MPSSGLTKKIGGAKMVLLRQFRGGIADGVSDSGGGAQHTHIQGAEMHRQKPGSQREDSSRPRFAWFPFGAGSRQCIGEGFAWMEGILALATILREWRVSLPAGSSETLETLPRITLRPKAGVHLQLNRYG